MLRPRRLNSSVCRARVKIIVLHWSSEFRSFYQSKPRGAVCGWWHVHFVAFGGVEYIRDSWHIEGVLETVFWTISVFSYKIHLWLGIECIEVCVYLISDVVLWYFTIAKKYLMQKNSFSVWEKNVHNGNTRNRLKVEGNNDLILALFCGWTETSWKMFVCVSILQHWWRDCQLV